MIDERRSEKCERARNTLPEELRTVFDDFVSDYKFAGIKHHGSPYVSYIILAEMVRAGWRLAADPVRDRLADDRGDEAET
jgi:hypothetical protein